MGEITRRVSDTPPTPIDGGLPRRLARDVQRAVDGETARGIVRGTRAQADTYAAHKRVQGAAFVTHTALRETAHLSAIEGEYIQQAPLGELRYKLLVDTFASEAAYEVSKLGRDV